MNLINHSASTVTPHIIYIAKFNWWYEDFVKVGITSKTVEERYAEERTYQLGEYRTFHCESEFQALGIESAVLKILYQERVYPKMKFNGYSECLKPTAFDMACQVTENLVNKYINNKDFKKDEMNELIKVEMNNKGEKAVSARELYNFLEVKEQFTEWAKRMFSYGFEEDKDFISFSDKTNGGRPSTDYVLTLDTAKEISMLQRTDKGKQARQYFIECEKRVNLSRPSYQIEDSIERAKAWIREEETHIQEVKHLKARQGAISDKKTATAMATAAGLTKMNNILKQETGRSKTHSTIAHVKTKTGISYNPYWLKDYCIHNGLEIKEISPMGYSTKVKSYPYESWLNVYSVDISKLK